MAPPRHSERQRHMPRPPPLIKIAGAVRRPKTAAAPQIAAMPRLIPAPRPLRIQAAPTRRRPEVIDLTGSSDEEDAAPQYPAFLFSDAGDAAHVAATLPIGLDLVTDYARLTKVRTNGEFFFFKEKKKMTSFF